MAGKGETMPTWLEDAVFYEIYPQSFMDSNADGIGDFKGIISRLDYIRSLGCNALWINPCFDSPFKDAGYDVRDYKKTAARYGTNEDLYRLFQEAHARKIHVLLDLVPGHTSEEHEWFRESGKNKEKEYSDRYIWTDFCFRGAQNSGYPYIGGECERSGTYLLNFFKCQPALNYGWLSPAENWQKSAEDASAIATREAMKDVMRFWMDHGCDGFRVDMASSLVKGDDDAKTGTSRIWKNVREMFDRDYPEAALVSEWNNPSQSLRAGFHMDFCLNDIGNAYSTLVRDYQNHYSGTLLGTGRFSGIQKEYPELEDHSYFKKDAGGDILRFLNEYTAVYRDTRDLGYMSMITCNHDTVRPSYNLNERELKLFYAFLFTMPGVPFLYYGDEIGMHYQNLPTKEGGYFRTGSRTPMQWTREENLGFSKAEKEKLYLPVDPSEDAPVVQEQEKDPESLLNTVRKLLKLRHENAELQADGSFETVYAQSGKQLLAYRRGELLMVLNPSSEETILKTDAGEKKILFSVGKAELRPDGIHSAAQSFAVIR
jgi:glycosidase